MGFSSSPLIIHYSVKTGMSNRYIHLISLLFLIKGVDILRSMRYTTVVGMSNSHDNQNRGGDSWTAEKQPPAQRLR